MPNQPESSESPSATLHVEGADTCLHIANNGDPAHVLAVVRVARGLLRRNLDPAVATAQLVSVLLSGFIEPWQIQVTSLPGDPRQLGTYSICPSTWRVVRHVSPTGVALDDINSSHFTDRQQADYELMFEQVGYLSRMVLRAQRVYRGGKSLGVSERVDEIRRVRDLARGSAERAEPEERTAEAEACIAACEEDWWSAYRPDDSKGT